MLGDVRDPQLVRTAPLELALDEVNGCRERRGPMPLPAAGQALEASTLHQQLDLTSADIDAASKPQLRVAATCAVTLAGVSVDLADLVGQPRGQRPVEWWISVRSSTMVFMLGGLEFEREFERDCLLEVEGERAVHGEVAAV